MHEIIDNQALMFKANDGRPGAISICAGGIFAHANEMKSARWRRLSSYDMRE